MQLHTTYHKCLLHIQYFKQHGKIDKGHNHLQDVKPAINNFIKSKMHAY